MLESAEPWDLVAEGYSKITMKVFQQYADEAFKKAALAPEDKVLDIACGPGTLTVELSKIVKEIDAVDFSREMISLLNKRIQNEGISNIQTKCEDAQKLSFADNSFDAAFSMFGLMFFPDRIKGMKEAHRVLKPGKNFVMTSWAPVADSPAMQVLFGAVRKINPDMPEPKTNVESLENPEFFKEELLKAGFSKVSIDSFSMYFDVQSVESFWKDMLEGSAPLVMLRKKMNALEWEEKEKLAIQYLKETLKELPTTLSSKAWIGCGVK